MMMKSNWLPIQAQRDPRRAGSFVRPVVGLDTATANLGWQEYEGTRWIQMSTNVAG